MRVLWRKQISSFLRWKSGKRCQVNLGLKTSECCLNTSDFSQSQELAILGFDHFDEAFCIQQLRRCRELLQACELEEVMS